LDKELESKYLSKEHLTAEELTELYKILDKRREIMDRRGIYDFKKA
jgi:hypothetical protein